MKINSITFTHTNSNLAPKKQQDKKLTYQNLSTAEKIYAGVSAAGIIGLTILAISQGKRIKNLKLQKAAPEQASEQGPVKLRTAEKLLPYKIVNIRENQLYQNFIEAKTTFIDFLKNSKEDAKAIKEFLFSVTSDKKASKEFIKEAISDPRQTIPNLKILKEKIGGEKNLIEWLQAPEGYQEAYHKYIENLAEKPETTFQDLFKISPDWHLHSLKTMFKNENFSFGKLPEEFQQLGDYSHFAEWINQQNYNDKERLLLEYGGKFMAVTRINEGKSGKIPYLIEFGTGPDTKRYILKVQQSWGCDTPYAKENLAYKSDSAFMNAQMDYYLTLHNCKNSPKFYYFDYKSNSGLYEFQEGNKVSGIENILDANKRLKDLNQLGIYYNDACSCNFIEKNGVLKVIDIGDSSFIDPLRPGAKGFNLQTPNWCGAGLPNLSMTLT